MTHLYVRLVASFTAVLCFVACDAGEPRDTDVSPLSPYIGGWPTYDDKEALGSPQWGGQMVRGEQVPRFIALDQHGDMLDLYDFAGQTQPLVIERVSPALERTREMGDLLVGRASVLSYERPGIEAIADLVRDNEVWWIRVVGGTRSGGTPTLRDVEDWAESYPVPNSPAMLDDEGKVGLMFNRYWGNTGTGGVPSLVVLDASTMLVVEEPDDSLRNIEELVRTFTEE